MVRTLARVLILGMGFLLASQGLAQNRQRGMDRNAGRGPNFYADVTVFPEASGDGRVEVFLSIPLGVLGPEDPDTRPVGRAHVMIIFYDSDGDQITGDEWSYHNIPLGKTSRENRGRMLSRRYTFQLPPGKVEAKIEVQDGVRDRRGVRTIEFKVPNYPEQAIQISSPVYGICRDDVGQAPEEAYYGDVLPHPSRRYGAVVPGPCVLFELRDNLNDQGNYDISYKLKSSFGETLEDSSFVVLRIEGDSQRFVIRPRRNDLVTGAYSLELKVRVGDRSVSSKSAFTVDESRMTFQEDPDKLRTVMKYVATNKEKARLEDVPNDSLGVFWEGFWAQRDPNPNTEENEALVQFLDRVEYATEVFGILEPGWRSDRGRIYIKFGSPDQIEEFYSETNRYPTLIWYYYQRGRNYVFQDLEGFGRYRLMGMQED